MILDVALSQSALVVAVDPGKVMNRVWVSDGSGLLANPASMPVLANSRNVAIVSSFSR